MVNLAPTLKKPHVRKKGNNIFCLGIIIPFLEFCKGEKERQRTQKITGQRFLLNGKNNDYKRRYRACLSAQNPIPTLR